MKQLLPVPPGPSLLHAWQLGTDLLEQGPRYFDRHGDTFQTRFLGRPIVLTRDPDFIWQVLAKKDEAFVKDRFTKGLSVLLGWGLVTDDGERYRARRREVQPFFQLPALERHLSIIHEEAEREVERLRREQVVDLRLSMTRATLAIALRCLLDAEPVGLARFDESMAVAMEYFAGVFGTMVPVPLVLPTPLNLRYRRARRFLQKSALEVVQQARARGGGPSLMDQLVSCQQAQSMTDEQLRDEALTMLVAGHETSALSLAYTLALLARSREQQDAVFEEQASLSSMKEVARPGAGLFALLEGLRLFPVTVALARECVQPVTVSSATVQKGTDIVIHQWAAQRNPKYFQRPGEFLPKRWASRPLRELPRGAFIPFGAGPRVCIGQHFAMAEMRVILEHVLRAFVLQPESEFPPALQVSITARPRTPVLVRLRPRRPA